MGRIAVALGGTALIAGCRRSPEKEEEDVAIEDAPRPRPVAPTGEPVVRVRVRRVRSLGTGVEIGAAEQWLRMSRDGDDATDSVLKGPVAVSISGRSWRVRDIQGHQPPVDGVETLRFSTMNPRLARVPLDETVYPGMLALVAYLDEDGKRAKGFDVVNHVGLEAYLPGVLAKELYAHWHPQTFTAQAVASRSFACTEQAYFRERRHFDLTDTQASQMYVGETAHERSQAAVADTRGMVLAYEDRLVSGYYSSCCGGLAASAVDAIGTNPINDTPPLHGRSGPDVCTEASVYRWTRERTTADVASRLRAYGRSRKQESLGALDGLAALEVAETNAHGRPTEYRVRDERDATVEIVAARLRQAMDYTRDGQTRPDPPMWSSFVEARIDKRSTHIEGRGLGHGVGLCQYGAEALARSDTKAREILEWYYPGVEIVTAY